MKIRNKFVNNSSSTSFYVYGIEIFDNKTINKAFKKLLKKEIITQTDYDAVFSSDIDFDDSVKSWKIDFNPDKMNALFENLDSEICVQFGDVSCFFGRNPQSLKDNETGKQFKDNTHNTLTKIFGKKIKVKWFNVVS